MKVNLKLVDRYLLIPGALSAAKYAQSGEMFARMELVDNLSEDLLAAKLVLQSCNTAWISPCNNTDENSPKKVRSFLLGSFVHLSLR